MPIDEKPDIKKTNKILSQEEAINYLLGLFRKNILEEEIREKIVSLKKKEILLREVTSIAKLMHRKIPRTETGELVEIDYYKYVREKKAQQSIGKKKYNKEYSNKVIDAKKIDESILRSAKARAEIERIKAEIASGKTNTKFVNQAQIDEGIDR